MSRASLGLVLTLEGLIMELLERNCCGVRWRGEIATVEHL